MTLTKICLLILVSLLGISCSNSSGAGDSNPRGKPSGKLGRPCVPDSELMAAGIVQGSKVSMADEDARTVMMVLSNGELCTGAAIAENIILTAAHCVVKGDPSNTSILLYPTLSCESGFNRATHSMPVAKIIINEEYDASREANLTSGDLAILVLAKKIPSDYSIYEIADPNKLVDDELLLYGYGKTGSHLGGAGVLRKTVIGVSNYFRDQVNKKVKIVQGNAPGICQGDSGGPSLAWVEGDLQLLGVNSYVTGDPGDVCNRESYQVMAFSYLKWINEKKAENLLKPR